MTFHDVTLCLHVVTAVLGVGQIAAMAGLVFSAPSGTADRTATWMGLRRLAMTGSLSLLLMLITGVLLEYSVGWGYHGTWWFRLSVLAFFGIGGILGWTRRTIRKNAEIGRAHV